jgi:hypothetical protein
MKTATPFVKKKNKKTKTKTHINKTNKNKKRTSEGYEQRRVCDEVHLCDHFKLQQFLKSTFLCHIDSVLSTQEILFQTRGGNPTFAANDILRQFHRLSQANHRFKVLKKKRRGTKTNKQTNKQRLLRDESEQRNSGSFFLLLQSQIELSDEET